MKARLLSNVTIQPLVARLEPLDVGVGDFTALILELLDPASLAASSAVSCVICVFDTDALLGDALYDAAAPSAAEHYLDALDAFCAGHPEKTVVSTTFCAGSARVRNFGDVLLDQTPKGRESALNGRLVEIARARRNLVLVDVELLFRRHGEERLVSSAFWYTARIRWTGLMFRVLGEAIRGALDAFSGKSRKVLVLDLDNTLWGGVVGELGCEGVVLSEDGAGAIYRDFQRALKGLKQMGVLLAICSKNNPADVDEVFERNRMMLLSRDDFAIVRANWETKPQNLLEIAQALNLGLDSFVFIDDSPVEREIVARALPDVAVPEFPDRIEQLPGWFASQVVRRYFPRYRLTEEDRTKTDQYRANEARRNFAAGFDVATFLKELEIVCTLRVDDPAVIDRAAQMTQKTSQFNLTTRRCSAPEVTEYVRRPDRSLVVLDYADRFGSEGSVALAMLNLAEARIDNFLMSCRVIGRNVEDRLLECALDVLRRYGASTVTAEMIPTRKNDQVRSFYDQRGFSVVEEAPDGRKVYQRSIV